MVDRGSFFPYNNGERQDELLLKISRSMEEIMAEKKSVYLEVNASQYDMDKVMDKAVKDYKKGNKDALKSIDLYVKPEDGKAYYVANGGKVTGSVDL